MKKLLVLLPTILLGCIVYGQQNQQYSQYMINQFVLNPAIAGTEGFIDVYLGYRNQWTGFEGAPVTYYISGHKTIGKTNKFVHKKKVHKNWHGVGAQLYRDQTGPLNRSAILVAYAYNSPVSKKARLSVGSFFGFKQLQSNSAYWKNIYDENDDFFTRDLSSGFAPEIQLGAVLYHPNYFVNLSVLPVLNSPINFQGLKPEEENHFGRYNRHYYLSTGIRIEPNKYIKFVPSIMLKYVQNTPLSLDLNLKISHEDLFWYGFSFRAMESVNLFAGLGFAKRYSVSYAFEWSLTAIRKHNYGTHEIILGMQIPPPRKIVCPSKYW
jgi:type IX secretion system PorP/SprF family membrane protein